MANNKIQIRRSTANATVTGLANGELAFTQASNTLHIGLPDGSGVLRIGGAQYPGILTNSHALVANSTGAIDKVIVANAVVTTLTANGSTGANGQVLVSNGSAIYWGTGTSGSNTYVQFNDSGVANGVAGFTFTKTSNTLFIGNTIVVTNINVQSINASSYLVGNVTTGSGGFFANAATVIVGNNSINTYITSGGISISDITVVNTAGVFTSETLNINNATIANTSGFYTTGVVNAASHNVGSDFVANSTGAYHTGVINAASFTAGANLNLNAASLAWVGNTTTSPSITLANSGSLTIGNSSTTQTSSIISVANSAGNVQITPGTTSILATGVVNALSFGAGTIGTGSGGSIQNSSTVFVGNDTVNAFLTTTGLNVNGVTIANTTGVYTTDVVNAASHTVGTNLVANASGVYHIGVINATSFNAGNTTSGAGGVRSNSTIIVVGNNTINTVITSAGLTVNGQSIANNTGFYTSGTVNALSATIGTAANFSVNTTHIVFDGPTISAVNASATVNNMTVNTNLVVTSNTTLFGNTVIGDSTGDRLNVGALVSSNLIPASNSSYDLGNNSLTWRELHVANLHATTGYFDGTVEIAGDLVITGNVTTTNVSSLIVSDPMIYLAGNNYTSDLLDIGFVANYFDGVTQRHTGLFRDASDGGIYKLFTNSEQELEGNNVVNTNANGWTLAILQTYIQSAGFSSNATAITITANSSLSVDIVANTMTLSSPLLGNSGGTGINTYTQEDIIVANSTNGFRKLGLGTSGYVLQSNGSALLYDVLDGGSF